jgi:hypothetical protein
MRLYFCQQHESRAYLVEWVKNGGPIKIKFFDITLRVSNLQFVKNTKFSKFSQNLSFYYRDLRPKKKMLQVTQRITRKKLAGIGEPMAMVPDREMTGCFRKYLPVCEKVSDAVFLYRKSLRGKLLFHYSCGTIFRVSQSPINRINFLYIWFFCRMRLKSIGKCVPHEIIFSTSHSIVSSVILIDFFVEKIISSVLLTMEN